VSHSPHGGGTGRSRRVGPRNLDSAAAAPKGHRSAHADPCPARCPPTPRPHARAHLGAATAPVVSTPWPVNLEESARSPARGARLGDLGNEPAAAAPPGSRLRT